MIRSKQIYIIELAKYNINNPIYSFCAKDRSEATLRSSPLGP